MISLLRGSLLVTDKTFGSSGPRLNAVWEGGGCGLCSLLACVVGGIFLAGA